MSDEIDADRQRTDNKGAIEEALADNAENKPQFRQEQEDQSARTIGHYIKNFLARLSLTDWITAIGTAVIAGATIWNVVVVTGQLQAMKDSAPDTARLVKANQDLASAAAAQAGETKQLVDANRDLASAARTEAANSGKLVDATNKSASAASSVASATKLSAINFVAAERGQFIADNLQLSGLKKAPDQTGLIAPTFTFSFTNFGRSPVTMKDYVFMMSYGSLTPRPKYNGVAATRYAIGPGGTWHSVKDMVGVRLTPDQASKVMSDELPVYIYGIIRFRDTFGKARKICFAYRFVFEGSDSSNRFSPDGPNSYWCDQ